MLDSLAEQVSLAFMDAVRGGLVGVLERSPDVEDWLLAAGIDVSGLTTKRP